MKRRKSRRLVIMGVVVAVLLLWTAIQSQASGLPRLHAPKGYLLVEKAKYYGGAQAAFIFRVDDYTVDPTYTKRLPDDFLRPSRYYRNYQSLLVDHVTGKYPWLRLTLGVITWCPSGSCSSGWGELRRLVQDYGWEAASHTRYHTRPPREPGDYLGSIADIESNITGYRVLTYIKPYGEAGPGEVRDLADHGVRIVMDSLPWFPTAIDADEVPVDLHFTVKATSSLPWKPFLRAALAEAMATGGVVVFYTHATSYDWSDPKELLDAVDYMASVLKGERVWVTTPGELYSYTVIYEASKVSYRVEGSRLIVDIQGSTPPDVWRVPLTIIIYTGGESVASVEVNGRPVERLDASWPLSKPMEGYMVGDGYVAVNAYPPARVVVTFKGQGLYVIPGGISAADSLLVKLRLASLILWAPVAARAVIIYRRLNIVKARLEQVGPEVRGSPRYAVVIPARNATETIGDVLRSLFQQTLKPVAVAVVDDASRDDTLGKASEALRGLGGALESAGELPGYEVTVYKVGNVRVHLMRSGVHRGKAFNVNRAAEALMEKYDIDYVVILDSDTILTPRAVERLIAPLESESGVAASTGLVLLWKPAGRGRLAWAVASAFRNIGGAILSLGLRFLESHTGELGGSSGAAMAVRAEVFKRLGGLPEDTLADDTVFVWRLQLEGYRAVFASDAVAYTVDPSSLRAIARKSMRIGTGLLEGAIRLTPRALAKRRFMLAASMIYNSLGGLPLTLGLAHTVVTLLLLSTGAYATASALKFLLAVPYAPFTLVVALIAGNPVAYFASVYALSLAETIILALALVKVHKRNAEAVKAIKSSLKYSPLLPVIMWVSSMASTLGALHALLRLATGKRTGKW